MNIFQCMVEIFVKNLKMCNSTKTILTIHWKIWFLYVEISRALRFKSSCLFHDGVIKRKHFPRYWPLVVTREFPSQRPVTRSFDVFFDLRLHKWLSKQLRSRRFKTPSRSSWRHSNVLLTTEQGLGTWEWRYVCNVFYQWLRLLLLISPFY